LASRSSIGLFSTGASAPASRWITNVTWDHERWPGAPLPTFDTSHVLFVTLFGIVVTMWGVVRILRPVPLLIAVDTVGRAAFSLAFVWALAAGHSPVVVAFLILEMAFFVAQGLGLRAALRADRESRLLAA